MSPPLPPDEIERIAHRRASAKLGWYIHATVYVLVNGGLYLLSVSGGHQRRWSVFPALGWGVGLLCHGISVWVLGSGSSLRERMVERERERLRRLHDQGPR